MKHIALKNTLLQIVINNTMLLSVFTLYRLDCRDNIPLCLAIYVFSQRICVNVVNIKFTFLISSTIDFISSRVYRCI